MGRFHARHIAPNRPAVNRKGKAAPAGGRHGVVAEKAQEREYQRFANHAREEMRFHFGFFAICKDFRHKLAEMQALKR